MLTFKLFAPIDMGYLPGFLSENDPRPAKEQIDSAYQHGGGWNPQPGWEYDPQLHAMRYPGDPVMFPLAEAHLRDETLLFYPHDYLLIVQKDGSFEMARVD